jgi:hypothetical protein
MTARKRRTRRKKLKVFASWGNCFICYFYHLAWDLCEWFSEESYNPSFSEESYNTLNLGIWKS